MKGRSNREDAEGRKGGLGVGRDRGRAREGGREGRAASCVLAGVSKRV